MCKTHKLLVHLKKEGKKFIHSVPAFLWPLELCKTLNIAMKTGHWNAWTLKKSHIIKGFNALMRWFFWCSGVVKMASYVWTTDFFLSNQKGKYNNHSWLYTASKCRFIQENLNLHPKCRFVNQDLTWITPSLLFGKELEWKCQLMNAGFIWVWGTFCTCVYVWVLRLCVCVWFIGVLPWERREVGPGGCGAPGYGSALTDSVTYWLVAMES